MLDMERHVLIADHLPQTNLRELAQSTHDSLVSTHETLEETTTIIMNTS